MFEKSIIRKTGQWWKLTVCVWGAVLGGMVMLAGLVNLEKGGVTLGMVFGGMAILTTCGVFACVSIRCPKCRVPWVWQGITGESAGGWVEWLLSQTKCPGCGYEPGTKSHEQEKI